MGQTRVVVRLAAVVCTALIVGGAGHAFATTVTPGKLAAVLRLSTHRVLAGSTVRVDGSPSKVPTRDAIASWTYSFGDGSRAVNGKGKPKAVSHVFASARRATVRLTVTDVRHVSSSSTSVVTVLARTPAAPVAPDAPALWPVTPSLPTSTPYRPVPTPTGTPTLAPSPTPATPAGVVSGLTVTAQSPQVQLSWSPPGGTSSGVAIRRAVGTTAPAGPGDGTLIASVSAQTSRFTDISVNVGAVYSYSLFAYNADASYAKPASATSRAVPSTTAVVYVCGHIVADTTWAPSSAAGYVMTCPVTVDPRATLTVQAGTWVKATAAQNAYPYQPAAQLVVQGTLNAQGTGAAPVTFTAIADDSVGGDTNGDGNTVPARGIWPGISSTQVGGTPIPVVNLDHTTVRYATNGVSAAGQESVSITNSLVQHSGTAGIALSPSRGELTRVASSTVDDSAGDGIQVLVDGGDSATSPTVTNNAVTGAGLNAITVVSQRLLPAQLAGNTGSHDQVAALVVTGSLAADLTLPTAGLPWAIGRTCGYYSYYYYSSYCNLTIPRGVMMTLGAGAVLKADAQSGLSVAGSLVSTGTPQNPAVLTSLTDDSAGGDTNGDGNGTAGTAGAWAGIMVATGAGSPQPMIRLDGARISYAATGVSSSGLAQISIADSTFQHISGTGVSVQSVDGGALTVTATSLDDLGGDGISATVASNATTVSPTVTNNAVTRARGAAVRVAGPTLVPDTLSGNTGSADHETAIVVSGVIVANATLPSQGLPWVIGSCGPYYYSCSYSGLVVAPGATLTVNPGAVVKVEAAGAITVQGSLIAAGSTTSPAVFTSLKDDSVGGDTNGDGNGTLAARGDWGGLSTSNVGGSPRPKLTLSNTVVNWTGTAVTASGLADVSVTSSQVSHSSSTALQLSPTSGSAITVSGTTVDDAVGDGIAVMMDSSDGGSPTVSGNTVTHVTGVAVRIFGMALTPSQLLGNIGSSDGQAVLMVSGAITGDLTLPTAGLPWVVGTAYSYYGYYYCPSTCGLTVGPGATLTLGAGAVLKADHTPLFVQGSLVATGTAASPAVLTSYRDDAVGGDLNGDGNGSSPVAGDWLGVQLSQASGYPAAKLTLGHAVISYAVTAIGNDSGTVAKVAVANSAIQHSSSGAVSLAPARGSSVSFTADTVDDARGDGLSVLMDSTDATAYPTITGNAITHARGAAVHVSSRRLLPPQLAGNTGSADATTAIVAEGSLASDLTLPTSGLPWVIGQACGQPPLCGLTVSPGVTLTLQPGAVLKARPGATLAVQGSLIGAGTAAQPVTITSINDDTAGGDTNGDGDGSVPATGEWVGVVGSQAATWPAPTIQLGHATVSYAAVALTATSAATLTHSRLVGDAAGVVGPATVNGSCANGTVDATNTYWGDPSGPAPTGHGASVSGCVSYLPYATT